MTCVFAGPNEDIPVKVSGNVKNGFEAEFVPSEVGLHTVLVEYNGVAVGGTPFFAKVPTNNLDYNRTKSRFCNI